MLWADILKREKIWYKHVDGIMSDGKPRTKQKIADELLIIMTSGNRSGRNVPTNMQITMYLSGQDKYKQIEGRHWVMIW